MLARAVDAATERARASGALQPIETHTTLLDDGGVRFIVRVVSSLARKGRARAAAAPGDPLGDYDPDLLVVDLAPAHYVLLNKFPVVAGHLLLVTRRYEPQERLLTPDDFAALVACLAETDALAFYNAGAAAGASQSRKHLQLLPLPLRRGDADGVPMERVLLGGGPLPFRHAFARTPWPAGANALHDLYRQLLHRCGIDAHGELQSAPYNMLVRRSWMLCVPRARACFESVAVNAVGFAGSLFVRSHDDLERVRAAGPMQVLRAVASA